jgi:hypothetical protein
MAKKDKKGTASGVDYNSMGIKNSTMDLFGSGSSIDPTDPKLKPVGERQYGETTETREVVDGRTKITSTTPWKQDLAGQGKSYKEAGVDPQKAKEYWKNNPDKYREYQKSLKGVDKGADVSVRFEDISKPKEPKVPEVPARKAMYYKYRSGGAGSESIGGATTLEGAKLGAQKFGNQKSTVVDAVYDEKAYGPGAMGKLIQTAEAKKANEIRSSSKENTNWKKDLQANKAMYSQMRKDVKSWRDSGSDPAKMPKSVSDFQKRIDDSYERVYTGSSKEKSTSGAAAYKFQKFRD